MQHNVLYIEQPAGVGFSTCDFENHPEDCTFNDNSAAKDNLDVILGFFEKYPEFKTNDFFITGESYSGIYVPYTSNALYHYNQANINTGKFRPNFKGFLVGNGVTNWKYDTEPAYLQMGYWHSLYSQQTYEDMQAGGCDYSGLAWNEFPSQACMDLYTKFSDDTDKVNIYNIFGYCWGLPTDDGSHKNLASSDDMGITQVGGQIKTYKKAFSPRDYTPWRFPNIPGREHKLKETPPCVDGEFIIKYMNRPEVRTALHIPDSARAFDMCASTGFAYDVLKIGSQWIYEALRGKIRMLHYSGDIDGAVPTTGTYNWIQSMNPKVLEEYRVWNVDNELAGYVEEYDGLTFVTVHGAGHMVPTDKPKQMFYLLNNWIKNNRL